MLAKIFPAGFEGGPMTPEFYLSMLTMHGTIMVFFVLTTAPQSGFGNYFLPIQIGAHDMAFPVAKHAVFLGDFCQHGCHGGGLFVTGGAPISGWTAYAPLSAVGQVAGPGLGIGQTLWIISIAIFCRWLAVRCFEFHHYRSQHASQRDEFNADAFDSLDLVYDRHPGFALLPGIACWRDLAVDGPAGGHQLFHSGGLVISDKSDRALGRISHSLATSLLVFWPSGSLHRDLPGMGVTSQLLSTFARKPIYGYRAMVYAVFAIGLTVVFRLGPSHVYQRA